MCKYTLVCLVLVSVLVQAQCLKILGVFHMTSRSHFILGSRLMTELANRGHEVTVISPFGEKNPPKNYTDVILTGAVEKAAANQQNFFELDKSWKLLKLLFFNYFTLVTTEEMLAHENVQGLLKSDAKFDVVVMEQFGNDAHRGLCYKYNAACVILSTMGINHWVSNLVGNVSPLSYVPSIYLTKAGKMNFWERLENVWITTIAYVYDYLFISKKHDEILKKYFPGAPSLSEINANISVVLLNSHVSTNQAVPKVPNMVEIGGFHLSPPKPLPEDLQKYLDGAKEGVVYFSLGSNVKSANLPKDKRDAILRVFGKLKQKVLWKWEDDVLPGQPPNVKLGKWLPQQSILAHPNVKVFITHGGLLSTTETIYFGKPIVAIPVFGDQKTNAKTAQMNGFGLVVQYHDLNEETLGKALNEILTNQTYALNAERRSKIMHDNPVKPLDLAVYWVEYAARHKNTQHFKSAALDLYWFQYYLVDVFAFFAGIALIFVVATKILLQKVLRGKTSQGTTPKKKKTKLN